MSRTESNSERDALNVSVVLTEVTDADLLLIRLTSSLSAQVSLLYWWRTTSPSKAPSQGQSSITLDETELVFTTPPHCADALVLLTASLSK